MALRSWKSAKATGRPVRTSGREKWSMGLSLEVFSPATADSAERRRAPRTKIHFRMVECSVLKYLLTGKPRATFGSPGFAADSVSHPRLRRHLQLDFLAVALDLHMHGGAGLDGAGGVEQIHQSVGPTAVECEQPIAGLQPRFRGRAVRQHFLDVQARSLVAGALVGSEAPLPGRSEDGRALVAAAAHAAHELRLQRLKNVGRLEAGGHEGHFLRLVIDGRAIAGEKGEADDAVNRAEHLRDGG